MNVKQYRQSGGSNLIGGGANWRSAPGPSSASTNGIDVLINNINSNNSSNNMQLQQQQQQMTAAGTPSSVGGVGGVAGGLTTSSLFSALQQEVAEETRLAALNAMTQRLMNSLEGN